MNRLENYIIKNLSILFMSIFSSLYVIASIIFLIKLASYTAIIQLSVLDMLKLYIFISPELILFTLPISFFVASALTIFKLSNDNEIVVLFSLGIHPNLILKILLKPAFFLTILLIFNFFIVIPHVTLLYKNFILFKKSEAKLNISASQYGHKFGNWLLYVGGSNHDKTYSDIVLFNKSDEKELLIKANKAKLINNLSVLKLKLIGGEAYSYSKKKFTQTNFDTMVINDVLALNLIEYESTLKYWNSDKKSVYVKRKKKLITNFLLSIFPLLSLFFIAWVSIMHARNQKVKIYLYLFLGIIFYYGAILGLISLLDLYTMPVVIGTWLIITYIMYRKKIVARF